jgi:hypothetical protein
LDVLGEDSISPEDAELASKESAANIKTKVTALLESAQSDVLTILEEGIDPVTDEEVELTPSQKATVRGFLKIKIDDITLKESLGVIDALRNFMVNHTTYGMEATLNSYEGAKNARLLAQRFKAFNFWAPIAPNFMAQEIASMPILFENIFRGRTQGSVALKSMGLRDYINGKAKANRLAHDASMQYEKAFNSKKPRGQNFMHQDNVMERAAFAYVRRSRVGSDADVQAEFEIRKDRLADSIVELKKGNKSQIKMGEALEFVYNRAFASANTLADVESNIDKTNKAAVEWWADKWSNILPELKEVSENIYNKIISEDNNYNPDIYKKIRYDAPLVDADDIFATSAFDTSTGRLFDKESSVLMDRKKFNKLPEGKYISLDFDKNMNRAFNAALTDVHTAAPTKQLQGFINSQFFNGVFPDDVTRRIVKDRIFSLVSEARGKTVMHDQEIGKIERTLAHVSNFGAARALGQVLMSVKQVFPVIGNTLVNARSFDFSSAYDQSAHDFMNNSGRSIANRGAEQMGNVIPVETAVESGMEANKVWDVIAKVNGIWVDNFLVKPDVFVARASWITYYKQSMEKQGVSMSDVDWSKHKLNDEAADYAQDMVDRQQNVSDAALLGEFLKSKNPTKAIVRKMLFPFANFMLNQKMRMYTDMAVLYANDSSIQDKKAAAVSLSGAVFEQLAFHSVGDPGALHHRPAGGGFAAHEQGHAHNAFIANHRNFCRGTIFHHVQQ